MAELTLETWERKFRADAKADNLAIFRHHLRSLDLEERTTAEALLEGTILVVNSSCFYASCHSQSAAPFLAAQTYDPAASGIPKYAFTFDVWGEACARLLIGADLTIPGLAGLFDDRWYHYQVSGYFGVLICRLEGGYTIDIDGEGGDGGAVSWLTNLLGGDLQLEHREEPMQLCSCERQVIGSFYVSVQHHGPPMRGSGRL